MMLTGNKRLIEKLAAAVPQAMMYVLVLLACGVALSKHRVDPDLWGHVRYGLDALLEGLPVTTTYSYTAEGHPWINHELLSETALAWGLTQLGPSVMLTIKCVSGIGLMAVFLIVARRQGLGHWMAQGMVLLTAANLMHFWDLRPQWFSYLILAAMIGLLEYAFGGWSFRWHFGRLRSQAEPELPTPAAERQRALWLIVPLMAVWANTHGAFVAGFAMLCVYLFVRSCERLVRQGRAAWRAVAMYAAVTAAAGLATLINPYGSQLHAWLWRALRTPRPEIIEWQPPELFGLIWLPLWALAACLVAALIGSRKPRDATHLVVLTVTLWQAVEHRRHIALLAILCACWMPVHFASLIDRLKRKRPQAAESRPALMVAAGVVLVMLLAVGLTCSTLAQHTGAIPVRRDLYPVSAVQFMADHQLGGKLVVRFKWAQYLLYALGDPQGPAPIRVAFDGRFRTCYPQQVVDMYFDFALGGEARHPRYRSPESPPEDSHRILEYGEPDLVLIDREQQFAVSVIQRHSHGWVLLYQDAMAQLWGRAARYDDPNSPHYLPAEQRQISDDVQHGTVDWPATPILHSSFRPAVTGQTTR